MHKEQRRILKSISCKKLYSLSLEISLVESDEYFAILNVFCQNFSAQKLIKGGH